MASNILFLFTNSSTYIWNDGITINNLSFSTWQFLFAIGRGITLISKIIFCSTLLYILCLKSSNMCSKFQKNFWGTSPPGPPKSKFLFTGLEKLVLSLKTYTNSTFDCSNKSTTPYRQILRSESGGSKIFRIHGN